MFHRLPLAVASLSLIAIVGCSSGNLPKAEQFVNDVMALQQDILAALESVNSPADADSAAARIDVVTAKFKTLINDNKGLKVSHSENEKLEKQMVAQVEANQDRMEAALKNAILKSGGSPAITNALQRFQMTATQMQFES